MLAIIYPFDAILEIQDQINVLLDQVLFELFLVLHFQLLLDWEFEFEVFDHFGLFGLLFLDDCGNLIELLVIQVSLSLAEVLTLPQLIKERNEDRCSELFLFPVEVF